MSSSARIHQTEDGHELRCPTCGARVTIVAALPLDEYLREIGEFAAAHEHAEGPFGTIASADFLQMWVEIRRIVREVYRDDRRPEEATDSILGVVERVLADSVAASSAAVEEHDPLAVRMAEYRLGVVDRKHVIATAAAMPDQPSASRCDLPPSTYGPCELPQGHSGGLCRARVGTMEEVQWPSRPAEKSTEGDPELLDRARRQMYAVHNHGPDEGPGLACRETLIGDCLRENREELHKCVREGYGLFHREQAPGTVGERWCRWAQTLGWPSLSARNGA